MKKLIIPISALFVVGLSYAQTTVPSNTENYIYTKVHLSDPAEQNQKQIETVQYFDGLGRPKQVVGVKASPTGKDVVTHTEYDGFGRQVKDFLPVPQSVTQNGTIYTSPLANATQTDIYGSEKIYAEKILENSPLNRIQQQIQVGTQWAAKPVKFDYEANTAEDLVRNYQTSTTWDAANKMFVSSLQTPQYFQIAKLYKNTVTDEDANKTIEFKNGRGQIVLIRKVISASENADTYYVYNEYNQLAYVMPPLASKSGSVDLATLDNLCYQYRYDSKYKLVEKKIPGKGWEYMVYDKQDRLVATQDANLRTQNQWLYTKYDQFGRVAIRGIATGSSRISEQNIVDALGSNNVNRVSTAPFSRQGMDVYYANQDSTYPNSTKWVMILSLNYYDTYPNYSFNPTFPTSILGKPTLTDNAANTGKSTKDLPVVILVKNIEDDNWTKNYSYYDTKGRAIGSYSINHLGGYTKTESELYFAGVAKQNITRHKRLNSDTEKVVVETFEYDHQNRLLVHRHKVDNNPEEILAQNKYNELSQLESKKVGGTNIAMPLQTIDYKYNIRGWMTKINDPADLNGKLFGYEIKYTNPAYTSLTAGKYNGNIAEVDWKTSNDGTLRRYDYQYDPLNRLANGIFSEPNSSLPQSSLFDESLEYDLNGNIAKLYRNSKGANGFAQQIDRLTYVYSGNRLSSVTDGSANYKGYPDVSGNNIAYDDNGNMTNQKDKGILKINYNFLNLPNYLEFDKLYYTRGTWQNENVKNFYGSDGTKLSKEHRYSDATGYKKKTTDYLNGFQYETIQSQIVTVLKFVPTSEGYFNFENNKYIYNYTDHLGNVRLSYFKNQNNSIEVLEENNYYPFGLKHEGYNTLTGNPSYKYQYNGKELQQETGQYDYGARFYMPDIGRWGVVDPLAEKYKRMSPYNYVGNNPAIFVDYDGRDFGISMDMKKGTITITGNYYALSRDMKAANGAIGKWNNASGNYSYNYKDANGTERSLKVVFKLTATEVKSTAKADLKNALDTDKSGVSNSFAVDNDRMKSEKPSTDGITINGKKITVRSTSSDDTGGHEIGHTLGLSDDQAISSDIMTHTTESGDTINSTYIQDILSYFDGNTANPNQASDKTKIPGNPNSVVIDTTNSNLKTSKDYENFKKGKVKSTPAE